MGKYISATSGQMDNEPNLHYILLNSVRKMWRRD
jgi:hypothetical protein